MARLGVGFAHLGLVALAALLLRQGAEAAVPLNLPFQVVRPSPDHASMRMVPEGLALLGQHLGGISLVSVVGPYHSGKSFLLNALLHHTQVFSIGSRTSPETMGIWLCRTNLTASDGTEVWLMDSEGFFGPGVDEGYDAKVFAVASLVGAHVVYNTVKVIDQQAVHLLEMLVQRAQLFRTRAHSSTTPEQIPDFLRSDTFPPLTWVVEDFVQDLPTEMKEEGATGWLRTYLDASKVDKEESPVEEEGQQVIVQVAEKKVVVLDKGGDGAGVGSGGKPVAATSPPQAQRQQKSDFLRRVYRDIRVHTLFLPATGREQLRDLSKLPFSDLTPEFREEVGELRRHILRSLRARTSNGLAMTGGGLASSLRFLVGGLQQGMFHELPSLWNAWALQVVAVSLNDADSWFGSLLAKIDTKDQPIPVNVYNDRLDESRENATNFYLALLRDFDSSPQVGELRKRMDARITGAVASYHERVRRWVGERSAKAKENFASFLGAFVLPANPSALDRDGAAASEKTRTAFSAEYTAFSSVKQGGTFTRRAVSLPAFTPDPVTQLAGDLRAQLGARSMENERAIQQLFKVAVSVVEEAIVHELSSSSGTLLSKARMAEVRKSAEKRSWETLDNQLSDHPWAKSVPHYRSSRALVQTEYLEARLNAFAAANEKRLASHFGIAVDRALAAYAANRSTIFMPATEADVDTKHTQMASASKQAMQHAAKELADTDAFGLAMKRLVASLADAHSQLTDKNVELWKVHSDEATRCALHKNFEAEKKCRFLCWYNTVPWYHKATARRHLSECFSQSPTGQQMANPLRTRVFEMWYAKDMAREAAKVGNTFTVLFGLFAAILCGCLYLCHFRRSPAYAQLPPGGYYGQPQFSNFRPQAAQYQPQQQQQHQANFQFQECNPGPMSGQGMGLRRRTNYFGA